MKRRIPMKKRLLGLALALIMIISLLPLTALAASPMPKFRFYDNLINPDGSTHYLESYFNASKTVYVVFEDVYDTDGTTLLGQKPVIATATPTDNYIKYAFSGTTATITIKNVNYKRTPAGGDYILYIVKNGSSYTNEFDVVVNLEGTNVFNAGSSGYFHFENKGALTFTGSGSLSITTSAGSRGVINRVISNAGTLNIKDTTLHINNTYDGAVTACIVNNGPVVIENSTVTMESVKSRAIVTSSKYNTAPTETTYGISIKGSTVSSITEGGAIQLVTAGPITIESSNTEFRKGTGNTDPFGYSVPILSGTHSSVQYKKLGGTDPQYKDWDNPLEAGADLTVKEAGNDKRYEYKYIGFKTVHECAALADDGDCTTAVKCACGKEVTPAKQHIAGANADDCTKDTICGNAGCTQVFEAKKGDAHVAGADDNDCTTDIKCTNCDQVATKGAEKHVWNRANCSVDGACTTTGCTQTVAAGTHTGGTATCKEKAKCAECGEAYGELGACAPKADDGDCTTDIKCSVCDKTTTAGETAHKYTDKNDTSCDNAGCTNTRKVEGTENPKTGDNTALVLMVALMATAAAAFVTTKKFAR